MCKNLCSLLLLVGVASAWVSPALAAFPDVPAQHPHGEGIEYSQEQGIVSGYPDGSFQPDRSVNRAEFTKIIMEALFADEISGMNCFPDVADEWFAGYVCTAKSQQILSGYPDGSFKPAQTIAFAEAAKIIVNAFGYPVDTQDPIWFQPFVEELGIRRAIPTSVNGFGKEMSRGEMAEIIYRLMAGVTDKPSHTYSDLENGVLYIPFNSGTVQYDFTVHQNNGQLSGGEILTGSCKAGECLRFDGVNDLLEIPDADSLDLRDAITLELWYFFPGEVTGEPGLIQKDGPASYGRYGLWLESPGFVSLIIYIEDEGQSKISSEPLQANQWYHLAGSYDGQRMRLFINGEQVAEKAVSGTLSVSEQSLQIGSDVTEGGGYVLSGIMDEVRLYDRALSPAQIRRGFESLR